MLLHQNSRWTILFKNTNQNSRILFPESYLKVDQDLLRIVDSPVSSGLQKSDEIKILLTFEYYSIETCLLLSLGQRNRREPTVTPAIVLCGKSPDDG